MKKQQNKNKLELRKFQITKILKPQKIVGGNSPIDEECSQVRTDDTQPDGFK